ARLSLGPQRPDKAQRQQSADEQIGGMQRGGESDTESGKEGTVAHEQPDGGHEQRAERGGLQHRPDDVVHGDAGPQKLGIVRPGRGRGGNTGSGWSRTEEPGNTRGRREQSPAGREPRGGGRRSGGA